jgi:hypothetical protein
MYSLVFIRVWILEKNNTWKKKEEILMEGMKGRITAIKQVLFKKAKLYTY